MMKIGSVLQQFYDLAKKQLIQKSQIPIVTEEKYFEYLDKNRNTEYMDRQFSTIMEEFDKQMSSTVKKEESNHINQNVKEIKGFDSIIQFANDYFQPPLKPESKKPQPQKKLTFAERVEKVQKDTLLLYAFWFTAFFSLFLISVLENYFLSDSNLDSIYLIQFLLNLIKIFVFCLLTAKSVMYRLNENFTNVCSFLIVSILIFIKAYRIFTLSDEYSYETVAYTSLYMLRMIDLGFVFSILSKKIICFIIVGTKKYSKKFIAATAIICIFLCTLLYFIINMTHFFEVLSGLEFSFSCGFVPLDLFIIFINKFLFYGILIELVLYISMYVPYLLSFNKETHFETYNNFKNNTILFCRIWIYLSFIAAIVLFGSSAKKDYDSLKTFIIQIIAFCSFNFLSFWILKPKSLTSKETSNHTLISFAFHLLFAIILTILIIHCNLLIRLRDIKVVKLENTILPN